MITNAKKYEGMKFIYEKEMPTEEQVPKKKDEIAGMESKEEGMSNGSEMEGKNKQKKRKVNEQEKREEDGDRNIIMIGGRGADSGKKARRKKDVVSHSESPLGRRKDWKNEFWYKWGSLGMAGGSLNQIQVKTRIKRTQKNSYKPQKQEI